MIIQSDWKKKKTVPDINQPSLLKELLDRHKVRGKHIYKILQMSTKAKSRKLQVSTPQKDEVGTMPVIQLQPGEKSYAILVNIIERISCTNCKIDQKLKL